MNVSEAKRQSAAIVLRTVLAFALAPLATPLFFLVVGMIQTDPATALAGTPAYFVIYGLFAYAAALTLGLLAYGLRPRSWDAWPYYYVVGGAGIGLITAAVLYLWVGIRWASAELFSQCAIAGAISGFCFWLIGIRKSHR